MRRRRILMVVAAAAVACAAGGPAERSETGLPAASPLRFAHGTLTASGVARLRTSSWWGGRYPTAGGEHVSVYLSASYQQDEAVARRWAEYFASLVHGPELGVVTVHVAPLAEVAEACGTDALGCYGADRLVTVGEDVDGIPATAIAAHEYGHHVAAHRVNAPWRALDWGPKRWATAMRVCPRTAAGTLSPGDGGAGYRLNPGEAFAETYRLLNERRVDPSAASWPIVSSALFPSPEALKAAEADVLEPWTEPKAVVRRHRFAAGRSRVWASTVATPLDGNVRVTLDLPPATPYRLVLADPQGRVVGRGLWSSRTRQIAAATVCGTRILSVRVERHGPPARVVLSTRVP